MPDSRPGERRAPRPEPGVAPGRRGSERRAAQVSETRLYRSLVDQDFVGIVKVDGDGRMRFVNPRWCAMVRSTEDALQGRNLASLADADDARRLLEALADIAGGGADRLLELCLRRADGTRFHAACSLNAIRDAGGGFRRVTVLVVDNTRRVRAEALQDEMRQVLELVARAAPLAQTLDALIATVQSHCGEPLAGQILVRSGACLRHAAAPSLPAALRAELQVAQVPATAWALGAAVPDGPGWRRLRRLAAGHGWALQWRHPVHGSRGQLLGALLCYAPAGPDMPSPDPEVLQPVLDTAGLAIERAQSQAALQEREERLRVALDTGRLGDWTLDLRSGALQSNALAKAHYGLAADAPLDLARVMQQLVHPDDRQKLRRAVRQAMRTQRDFDVEYRVVWPDRSVHWLTTRGRVFRDAAGRPEHIAGVCQDMTERRLAEEALRATADALHASETRLRTLTDVTPSFLWSALPDGRITFASERWYSYTGLERDSGIEWPAVVHPEDLEATAAAWADAIAHASDFDTELRLRRHDGNYRWFLVRAMPLRDADGHVHLWFGSSTDIDDRRRAEEALRVSEQRARLAMDLAEVGTWTWEPGSGRITGDARWCGMCGVEPGTVLDLDRIIRVHPDDLPRVRRALRATLSPDSDGSFAEEYRWVHRDGSTRWTTVRGQMLYREGPRGREPVRMLGSAIDVTTRRKTEDALREADRRKDEFLAMLAHELRNPLAPLRNSLHMLRMDLDEAERRRLQAVMERQVAQMVRLVDDLLEVSRITRGKIALHPEAVLLQEVIDQAVETSRPLLDAARHTLVLDLPDAPVALEADPVRIAQVLSNLLNNAAKYTDPDGQVTLSARREGAEVVVRVRDNGAGIAPEHLDHVFDLFSQAERTLHSAQGGLGIGLTLVRELVELHGGRVSAHSDGIGLGSTFEVRLPVGQAQPERDAAPVGEAASCQARCKVLVVDDNREYTDSMVLFLRLAGHEVRGGYDAAEGMALAREFAPDAVLLDVGLPDMDGHALCQQLRAQPGGQERVLVAVTGWGQAEDRRRSKEAGFDAHLVKPVDPEALLALVDSLCRARQCAGPEAGADSPREVAGRLDRAR